MIHANNLTKQYGPKILFRNSSFQINPGEKIGLVGPNGNGKSTLFRVLTGDESVDGGNISKSDRVRMGYFSQDIENMSGSSVLDEVKNSLPGLANIREQLQQFEQKLTEEMSEVEMNSILEKYGEAQAEFERLGGY
ncbi:MAG: glycosyl transferase family 1, partial [Bdellovibrio sp. CG10_big_fil_rev_8_21_14_0_10_47_8]